MFAIRMNMGTMTNSYEATADNGKVSKLPHSAFIPPAIQSPMAPDSIMANAIGNSMTMKKNSSKIPASVVMRPPTQQTRQYRLGP